MKFNYEDLARWSKEMESGDFLQASYTANTQFRRYTKGLHDECSPIHNKLHRDIWETLISVSINALEMKR